MGTWHKVQITGMGNWQMLVINGDNIVTSNWYTGAYNIARAMSINGDNIVTSNCYIDNDLLNSLKRLLESKKLQLTF